MAVLVIILSFLFSLGSVISAWSIAVYTDEGWSTYDRSSKIWTLSLPWIFFIPICFLYDAYNIIWFHLITLLFALILLSVGFYRLMKREKPGKGCWGYLVYGLILLALSLVAYFCLGNLTEDAKSTYSVIAGVLSSLGLVSGLIAMTINWRVGLFIVAAALIFGSFAYISGLPITRDNDDDDRYDDVFKKDPNTWTEDEKEYVNDLFEYIGK